MSDSVVIVGQGGEREARGQEIWELLDIEPPDDGGSVRVMVELLSPTSPWGSPLRLRDEWAPFSLDDFAQKHGAGRYRFRVRKPDGKWGTQREVVLAGPLKWEKKWREYYHDEETGEVRKAEAPAAGALPTGLELMLQQQAKSQELQQQMMLAMMQQQTQLQIEAIKASSKGKQLDPVEQAASVFGLVGKVRELAGDAPPAKEGWAAFLEGFTPVASALGEAITKGLAEEKSRPAAGTGSSKPAPERQQVESSSGSKGSLPSQAQQLELLRQVRTAFERRSPPLLAAELIEIAHPELAAAIVEAGREDLDQVVEQLARFAPEFQEGVGREWVALVGQSLVRSADGQEPLDEACVGVDELEELLSDSDDDEVQEPAEQPAAPAAVPS